MAFQVTTDGAWTWFNDERAIFLPNGNLLVGYVRKDGRIAVTNFDPVTNGLPPEKWSDLKYVF